MTENPIGSALLAVTSVLRESQQSMNVGEIVLLSKVSDEDARDALRKLAKSGQIELIPGGHNGNRYAWLDTGHAVVTPPVSAPVTESTDDIEKDFADHFATTHYPKPFEGLVTGAAPLDADGGFEQFSAKVDGERYMVRVPKRKPRILSNPDQARDAALAAVRNGAPRAEVFILVPAGVAKRDVVWDDTAVGV